VLYVIKNTCTAARSKNPVERAATKETITSIIWSDVFRGTGSTTRIPFIEEEATN